MFAKNTISIKSLQVILERGPCKNVGVILIGLKVTIITIIMTSKRQYRRRERSLASLKIFFKNFGISIKNTVNSLRLTKTNSKSKSNVFLKS
jgi:hypothetical protein